MRFGISCRIRRVKKSGYRDGWTLDIGGCDDQRRFLNEIGVHGARGEAAARLLEIVRTLKVGSKADTVPAEVWNRVRTVLEELGTITGTVLVTYGDVPLLRTETLAELIAQHEVGGNAVTVLTAEVPDPTGYGRIIRDPGGAVLEIVEEKDATPEQRAIKEMNSGIYAFDGQLLADAVKRVSTDNAQGEEYLTDVFAIQTEVAEQVATRLHAETRAHLQGAEAVLDRHEAVDHRVPDEVHPLVGHPLAPQVVDRLV